MGNAGERYDFNSLRNMLAKKRSNYFSYVADSQHNNWWNVYETNLAKLHHLFDDLFKLDIHW